MKEELLESMMNVVAIEAGYLSEEIHDDVDIDVDSIISIQSAVLSCGGQFEYSDGVFETEFEHWQSVDDFCVKLDDMDAVESYEVMAFHRNTDSVERVEIDIDNIVDESKFFFVVLVYLTLESSVFYDETEEVELDEVKRRIKVNSQGKRRVKMQCRPGFKWDGSACVKITGAELAVNRKAKRRMAISKRSQGNALKIRVLRKTRKANRFRKAMGLGGK